jgi:hypothetical protein
MPPGAGTLLDLGLCPVRINRGVTVPYRCDGSVILGIS